jgi:hypothetical protein
VFFRARHAYLPEPISNQLLPEKIHLAHSARPRLVAVAAKLCIADLRPSVAQLLDLNPGGTGEIFIVGKDRRFRICAQVGEGLHRSVYEVVVRTAEMRLAPPDKHATKRHLPAARIVHLQSRA